MLSAFVLSLAIAFTPAMFAQEPATSPALPDTLDRVQALEKQVQELRAELAALKPAPAPAAGAQPAPVQNNLVAPAGSTPATNSPAESLASLLGATTFSGFVDVYYGENFNNPASRSSTLRSFDSNSNQFGLNMVELVADKPPDPSNSRTGYHIALGFGQAMNAVNGSDPGGLAFDQYLKEAYFSYLAPVGKGLQVDVGKFVTPAGAEVIETKDNWNYSRGLLFSYAIPYYHFGARAKYSFNDKYSLTGYFVNGWNNVVDNNSGKTYGLSFGWNPTKKWSVTQNYMAGPEQNNVNSSWRQLWDTVVTYSPTNRLSLMANTDYGRGDRMTGIAIPVYWTGVGGYLKYQFNSKYAIATRYEYYNDHYGFTTGTAQHLDGFTATLQRTMATHILTRVEYRQDFSNQPVFARGTNSFVRNQPTLAAGLVFMFDSHEGK